MSYHNGSVWPHDNALIAAGFARYGFAREAARIFEGLFDASTYIDLRACPSCSAASRGSAARARPSTRSPARRRPGRPPRRCRSCSPASASASIRKRLVFFDQPVMPDFVDGVQFRPLSVGSRSVDATIGRKEGRIVTGTV